jgi:hypothetical protein
MTAQPPALVTQYGGNPYQARHCERSEAIAYTTDRFSVLVTASSRLNCDFKMIILI